MSALRIALLGLLLASVTLMVGVAGAAATTYCVQNPACVAAGGSDQPTIAAALAAANGIGGLDRVEIGPGTFVEDRLVASADDPVDIVGDGIGRTVIALPAGSSGPAMVLANHGSSVSDLSIALSARTGQLGLDISGTARRIAVTAADGMTGTGVLLYGSGSFLDGSIALPGDASWGVVADRSNVATAVERSTITAHAGIYNVRTVRQVRVNAVRGIEAITDFTPVASTTVDDALVQMAPGSYGDALEARIAASAGSATLVARHVTVIGNGQSDSVGVSALSGAAGPGTTAATVIVSDSILLGLNTDLLRTASGGSEPTHTSVADIAIDYSSFDPAKERSWDQAQAGTVSGSIDAGPHNVDVDPRFRDPAGGDYSLLPDSPLIDRGSPDPPAADEPTTDLAGNTRVVDGNGDGAATSDVGAFEYVPPLPPSPVAAASPSPPPAPAAPELTGLSLNPSRFAVLSAAAAGVAKRRQVHRTAHGTTIHVALSRAATVTFVVERLAVGRRAGGACVKPTRALRTKRRCRRWVSVLTFARHGRAGANTIPFSGRRPSGPLAPRSYRLRAVARADGLSSPPRTARFAVVRS